MKKRKALGKGLSALIPDVDSLEETQQGFFSCPVDAIEPNPFQPRQQFSKEELEQMALSVREKGILTPLLVTKKGNRFQLIAGERRWRAAQMAGLERVPVVLREASPVEALELALIENIHRKDLNPVEEALAYKRLIEEAGVTHDEVARRVGKDRTTITNLLRLLKLPNIIQKDLIDGRITMGHARVLAGVKSKESQLALRQAIIKKGLSVRQVEDMVKRLGKVKKKKPVSGQVDSYFQSLMDQLKRSLGTKVEIKKGKKGGQIVIHFFSDQELDRLLETLM